VAVQTPVQILIVRARVLVDLTKTQAGATFNQHIGKGSTVAMSTVV
jgi:hypothetical protein